MPSLFRILLVIATAAGVAVGGLYVLAVYFEPEQKEVTENLPAVKIRR